ncbi:16S rRNA (cytosine(967)-C(5))-methyltransferase RsmB [bacterium]|nr:16S rRNA (cytosine(967)-C(5))-methyltransferase RsmB [bacterium]
MAAEILFRVCRTQAYADILMTDRIGKSGLQHADRALVQELVYGVLRWKGQLDYILQEQYHGKWKKLPDKVRIVLEIALYQILHLDRIPGFAIVHEAVDMTKRWGMSPWSGLVNAILRHVPDDLSQVQWPVLSENPVRAISIRWSHPEWLVSKWLGKFEPDRVISICKANNEKSVLSIRVNTAHGDSGTIVESLKKMGYVVKPGLYLKEFFRIVNGTGLFETDPFLKGVITVQDESAGLAGRLLNPQDGDKILDMASAPGGKAGHIAELSMRRARILALDLYWDRLVRLKETIGRLDHKNVTIVHADAGNIPGREFDKILLDAPCSGIGVIRKRMELRWRIRQSQVDMLAGIQKKLLTQAVKALKPGGVIVYSTCTVLDEENQRVIDWFLEHNKKFDIEHGTAWIPENLVNGSGAVETWPDLHAIDGSYAVRLKHRSVS